MQNHDRSSRRRKENGCEDEQGKSNFSVDESLRHQDVDHDSVATEKGAQYKLVERQTPLILNLSEYNVKSFNFVSEDV